MTGTAATMVELLPKLLELARDLLPNISRVSVLGGPPQSGDCQNSGFRGESARPRCCQAGSQPSRMAQRRLCRGDCRW